MAHKAAPKKSRSKKNAQIDFLEETLAYNAKAVREGPKKKTWSTHDLRTVRPLTETQRMMFESFMNGNHVIANGSAGTGKSFVGLFLALNEILNPESECERIIIVRSAVASRDIGFLPGDVNEKMAVFEVPYKDILGTLLGKKESYDNMKEAGVVEFMPTSFVRGLTWDRAVVVVDEAQSLTLHELNSVITRCGKHTKMLILGDIVQTDLIHSRHDTSGFVDMLRIAEKMPEFDIIKFTRDDIVRSPFVRSWICAYEDYMDTPVPQHR